jgi:hypothetical protein
MIVREDGRNEPIWEPVGQESANGAFRMQERWLCWTRHASARKALADHETVLSLDADQVLTDELILEIEGLKFDAEYTEYRVARKLFVGDQFMRWGGHCPDYQLRLFKKSLGGFSDLPVHECVQLPADSRIRKLKNPLNHYSYDDFEEMDAAFNTFARLSTKKCNKLLNPFLVSFNFGYAFLNKYLFRLGYLHGLMGLRLGWIYSKYSFNKCIFQI